MYVCRYVYCEGLKDFGREPKIKMLRFDAGKPHRYLWRASELHAGADSLSSSMHRK